MNVTKEQRHTITIRMGADLLVHLKETALRQSVALGKHVTHGDLIRHAAVTMYPIKTSSTKLLKD